MIFYWRFRSKTLPPIPCSWRSWTLTLHQGSQQKTWTEWTVKRRKSKYLLVSSLASYLLDDMRSIRMCFQIPESSPTLFKYLKQEMTTLLDKQTQDTTAKFKDHQYFRLYSVWFVLSSLVQTCLCLGRKGSWLLWTHGSTSIRSLHSSLCTTCRHQARWEPAVFMAILLLTKFILFVQTTHVSVGKMDIVWRTKFGEKGRIQTGQLKAVVREMYSSGWFTRFSSDGTCSPTPKPS